jgi:YD repeat-containing protein
VKRGASRVGGGVTFTSRTLADLAYDSPYTGSASYGYVAWRLASMATPGVTTIAMGYDQNGRTTRRDQWFTGLTGAFSATGSFADDGRMLSASFASAYSATATWTGSYDSAGRPVKVGLSAPTALAAALWEAPLVGTQSPYDALDRVV